MTEPQPLHTPRVLELLQSLADLIVEDGLTVGRLAAGLASDLPKVDRRALDTEAAAVAGDTADQLEGLVGELLSVTAELHPLLVALLDDLPTVD